MKNLFKYQYLDNLAAAAILAEEQINELEIFVQSEQYFKMIPANARLLDFHGSYANSRNKFRFMISERNIIRNIRDTCKTEMDLIKKQMGNIFI